MIPSNQLQASADAVIQAYTAILPLCSRKVNDTQGHFHAVVGDIISGVPVHLNRLVAGCAERGWPVEDVQHVLDVWRAAFTHFRFPTLGIGSLSDRLAKFAELTASTDMDCLVDIIMRVAVSPGDAKQAGLKTASEDDWRDAGWLKTTHGLQPNTLRKAHQDGRLEGEKRGNRWFYRLAHVKTLWPDQF